MLQIIGKGGFAREVSNYVAGDWYMVESHEINTENPSVLAIGDGNVRKKIFGEYSNLLYIRVNSGKEYGLNSIGKGTIICPGTILTTGVKIGSHVIINLNCTIGHDAEIGDFTTLSPGVNVSGNVKIGNTCYIGTNAVIREGISICDDVTIGAGGVVVKDITEPGIYVGNPVKKIK